MKTKITNIAFDPRIATAPGNGVKGVNSLNGLVPIELGETVEVEISDAELRAARATGWFHIGDNPPPPPSYFNQTIAQRRAGGNFR